MKKLFASFGWILLILPLISVAGSKTLLDNIHSVDNNSDEREISGFSGVSSSGSFEVYIILGATESLRLEGNSEDLENVETKVEKGVLKIRTKSSSGRFGFSINRKIKVYITAKTLEELTVSGSGDMEVSGTVNADRLNLTVSGSGSIKLNAAVLTVNTMVSGSGGIDVSGSAKKANIAVSGSGKFTGRDLKAEVIDIKVSGSGHASVYASRTLNAALSGSGGISYSGNAQVNQSKSGSGRIAKI